MAMFIPTPDTTSTQHDATAHLAVRNTRWRRWLTLAALATTAKLYAPQGACRRVSPRTMVKTGRAVHLTEAATLQFIASNTSLPVPSVRCAFVHRNRAFIVMDYIASDVAFWARAAPAQRQRVLARLARLLDELRRVPPPDDGVQSCVGGSLHDARMSRSRPRFGPFASIHDFHAWLRDDLDPADHPERVHDDEWAEIGHMVARHNGPWRAPVFAHGNLQPAHLLVRDGELVGIVDWAFAGWYPAYWEYTSAARGIAEPCLAPHPEALKMEQTRQKWWGRG